MPVKLDQPNSAPALENLQAWVVSQLNREEWAGEPGDENLVLKGLDGDAGFRCYYRIDTLGPAGEKLIAVFAPPAIEKNHEFVNIANYLLSNGMRVPKVYFTDFEYGFMLLEDLGPTLLFDVLSSQNVDGHYGQAIEQLIKIQAAPVEPYFDQYDESNLSQELELFRQWFVPELLAYDLTEDDNEVLDSFFNVLLSSAAEQPQAFVLRDFHSRNIIVGQDHSLGFIDFQDGLWGPISYDLVSLLRDCYVHWPDSKVQEWVGQYFHRAQETGLIEAGVSHEKFQQWFDFMGLQRHIKVLGIFARLNLRDGKDGYLKDLPLVIRYTLEVAQQYDQCNEFVTWFKTKLLPRVETQHWYSDYLSAGENAAHLTRS